jgi:hypothetical protein
MDCRDAKGASFVLFGTCGCHIPFLFQNKVNVLIIVLDAMNAGQCLIDTLRTRRPNILGIMSQRKNRSKTPLNDKQHPGKIYARDG